MPVQDVLDDGQTEPGSAHFARPRGIDAIEPFGQTRQMLARDPRTLIAHADRNPPVVAAAGNNHRGSAFAVFKGVVDQVLSRAQLDPEMSLWDSLTTDKEMRVSGQSDQVMVRGQPRHVVGYLKDFLFDERQARAPVRALSGGEKARLLLAKIMARESNLLVLDEPTNDLDVETLDLLQELLDDFDGTVMLISHDRDFLDRVATTTIAMEGRGRATVYAGGWSDYQAQKREAEGGPAKEKRKPAAEAAAEPGSERVHEDKPGLSFTEKHRLEELPGVMDRLNAEIARLEGFLADPELFSREPVKFQKASEALVERQDALASAEEEWLELAEKAEG